MEYRTVFDIANAGYKDWTFPAFGLIFVAVGAFLVADRKLIKGWLPQRPRAKKAFAFFYLGFAVLWTVATFASTFTQYRALSHAEAEGRAKTVEGVVSDFKPMPVTGHAVERFCVGSKCFKYSDYVVSGGFNNTSSHGGPIREGLPVRVTFVGGDIIKLEVAER